jgi:hypothetical protein
MKSPPVLQRIAAPSTSNNGETLAFFFSESIRLATGVYGLIQGFISGCFGWQGIVWSDNGRFFFL